MLRCNPLAEFSKSLAVGAKDPVDIRSNQAKRKCISFQAASAKSRAPAYWRKKANVSRETDDASWPARTKWGVAASLPSVRSCKASPVWKAVGAEESDEASISEGSRAL
jgi:hypothetical protein